MIGIGRLDWYGGEYLSIGVQFVPEPVLNITTSGQNVLLSWLVPSQPFTLQQSSDLATWSAVGVTPTYTNLHYEVSILMTGNRNFFRLVPSNVAFRAFPARSRGSSPTGSTPRHAKGLSTCCYGEEPHTVGWRFTNERRAISLDPNCGWARGKADVLYVADAFAVMAKVKALLAGRA
jgi:hypothetical protein